MAESSIEWTDYTFNPWIGCQAVSPGCDHCYAETQNGVYKWNAAGWGPHAARHRTSAANWKKPLAWNRKAEAEGVRRRVFCASLADVFDNHASIDPQWRLDLWELIAETPAIDWLLLTKRPQNIKRMLPDEWDSGWPNVWLGTTVENQSEADRRIPHLLAVPAKVRFLSCEPLLEKVDLQKGADWGVMSPAGMEYDKYNPLTGMWEYDLDETGSSTSSGFGPRIDWVIAGGESGPKARPMYPDWARALRDQCAEAGTAFFFKQWGEWAPNETQGPDFFQRVGKKAAGALLDGKEHREFPNG